MSKCPYLLMKEVGVARAMGHVAVGAVIHIGADKRQTQFGSVPFHTGIPNPVRVVSPTAVEQIHHGELVIFSVIPIPNSHPVEFFWHDYCHLGVLVQRARAKIHFDQRHRSTSSCIHRDLGPR